MSPRGSAPSNSECRDSAKPLATPRSGKGCRVCRLEHVSRPLMTEQRAVPPFGLGDSVTCSDTVAGVGHAHWTHRAAGRGPAGCPRLRADVRGAVGVGSGAGVVPAARRGHRDLNGGAGEGAGLTAAPAPRPSAWPLSTSCRSLRGGSVPRVVPVATPASVCPSALWPALTSLLVFGFAGGQT